MKRISTFIFSLSLLWQINSIFAEESSLNQESQSTAVKSIICPKSSYFDKTLQRCTKATRYDKSNSTSTLYNKDDQTNSGASKACPRTHYFDNKLNRCTKATIHNKPSSASAASNKEKSAEGMLNAAIEIEKNESQKLSNAKNNHDQALADMAAAAALVKESKNGTKEERTDAVSKLAATTAAVAAQGAKLDEAKKSHAASKVHLKVSQAVMDKVSNKNDDTICKSSADGTEKICTGKAVAKEKNTICTGKLGSSDTKCITNAPAVAKEKDSEAVAKCPSDKKYSKPLNKCLNGNDWERVQVANNKCTNMQDGAEKDSCFKEVHKFDSAQVAHKDSAKESQDKISGSGVAKVETAYNAAAAIYGAIQFFQAGSIKSAFNGLMTCTSAPLGLAAGIAVMVSRSSLKKEVKAKLQAVQAQFKAIEELKGKVGVTYEVQVMALNYYVKALDVSIEIAELHAKTYKMNVMMYGLVTGIAAYEIATGQALMSYPPSAATGAAIFKCATTAAIGAGVGLGFAGLLLSTANKMKSKYQGDRGKIKQILARYEARFKGAGGLWAQMNNSNLTQDAQSLNNPADFSTLNQGSSATIIGSGSDVTKSLRPGSCADSSGELDEDCSKCKPNGKNCMKFPSLASFSGELKSFASKNGYSDVMKDGDKILNGKLNVSSLNSNAIDKKYQQIQNVNKRLLGHLKKKGVSQKDLDTLDPVLAVRKYLKKNESSIADYMKTAEHPFKVKGLDNMKIEKFVKNKELANEMKYHQSNLSPVKRSTPKPKVSDIDFGKEILANDGLNEEDSVEETNRDEMLALAKKANMDAGEYGPGVILDSNLSIFKTISNRYNVLRIKKRFSRNRQLLR